MDDSFLAIPIVGILFIGLPWIILHYVTQWRKSSSLSMEDEKLLDELHEMARKLDDRMRSIERIIAADDPGFRSSPARSDPRDHDMH